MIELKLQRPYVHYDGEVFNHLEKHYAEDANGVRYKIKQVETGIIYDEAVDIYPCKYTYEATNEPVEVDENEQLAKENKLKTTVEQ